MRRGKGPAQVVVAPGPADGIPTGVYNLCGQRVTQALRYITITVALVACDQGA